MEVLYCFIHNRSSKPGIARKLVPRKNQTQPRESTSQPESIAINVLPKATSDVSSANWVPVKDLLHNAERYATKAVEPKPPAKLSKPIAIPST